MNILKLIKSEIKTIYRVDIKTIRSKFFTTIFNFLPDMYSLRFIKALLLRFGGAKIHVFNIYIKNKLKVDNLMKIKIGKDVFINKDLMIEGQGFVEIKSKCQIGPNVMILTTNHTNHNEDTILNIEIGHNVWIGAGVIITPGVKIGSNVSIGAGSVLTKDISNGALWCGNPARKVK